MLFYLGCDRGQGSRDGPPVSATELSLRRRPPPPRRRAAAGAAAPAAHMALHPRSFARAAAALAALQAISHGSPVVRRFIDLNLQEGAAREPPLCPQTVMPHPLGPRLGKQA